MLIRKNKKIKIIPKETSSYEELKKAYSEELIYGLRTYYEGDKSDKVVASTINSILTSGCPILVLSRGTAQNLINNDSNIDDKMILSGRNGIWAEAQTTVIVDSILTKIREQSGRAAAVYELIQPDIEKEMMSLDWTVRKEYAKRIAIQGWEKLALAKDNLKTKTINQSNEIVHENILEENKNIEEGTIEEDLTLCPVCKKLFTPTIEMPNYCSQECKDKKINNKIQSKIEEQKIIDKEAGEWLDKNNDFLKKLGYQGNSIGGQVKKLYTKCAHDPDLIPDKRPEDEIWIRIQDQHRCIVIQKEDLLKLDSNREGNKIIDSLDGYESTGLIKGMTINKDNIVCVLIDMRKNINTEETLSTNSFFPLEGKKWKFITASELRGLINE